MRKIDPQIAGLVILAIAINAALVVLTDLEPR